MSYKNKIEISPQTIISSIDKELKDLISDIPKGFKPRIISIQETLKMLNKKIKLIIQQKIEENNEINNQNFNNNFNLNLKDIKSQYDNNIGSLILENNNLKNKINELEKFIQILQNNSQRNNSTNHQMNNLLNEEKNKSKMLLLQVKTVEDSFKILLEKYNKLEEKHNELLNDCSKMANLTSNMKRINNKNKNNYN